MLFPHKNISIVITQNAIVYKKLFAVIMFPPKNTSLIPVTKYVNGVHCITCNIIGCSLSMSKFHIIGVNQKNSCINIPSKFEKSGTNVVTADVNLVNAIKKQYAENIIYININILGKNPYIALTIIDIIIKNNDTKLLDINDIIGIASIGNTTFFTK